MRSDEILRLHALQLKAVNNNQTGAALLDAVLEDNPSFTAEKMRNICAFISPQLFADVDGLCDVLNLSKRQVVEMALIDLMAKAKRIMEQVQPFPEQ